MPIPTYDKFIEPVLRYLAAHPDGARAGEVHDGAAAMLDISDMEQQEMVPSRTQPLYKNRAGWAHDRLKRAGLSSSPRRGYWQLTRQGSDYARDHAGPLLGEEVDRLASDFNEIRLGERHDDERILPNPVIVNSLSTPDDRLGEALKELRQNVAAELQETLAQASPAFFETVVLDLLHRMGYGTSRTDLQRVGGVGDAGIDGVISLDKLGLEKVYVQAKKWQQTVGRPEVQGFYGALAGQRARKGVFITTSGFSQQAMEFARSVEQIVLIDGQRLADLMIEHEVGIAVRPIKVPKLDRDYFDQE